MIELYTAATHNGMRANLALAESRDRLLTRHAGRAAGLVGFAFSVKV